MRGWKTASPTTASGVMERAPRWSSRTTRARAARSGRSGSPSSSQRVDLVECAQHRVLERFAGPPPDLDGAQPALGRPPGSGFGVVDHDRVRSVCPRIGEDGAVVRRARLPNVEEVTTVDAVEEVERAHRLQVTDEGRVLVT